MANRCMTRCSMSLIIREMQTKWGITSYQSEQPRLKRLQIINAGKVWRKRNLPALLVGMWTGTATMEGLQNTENRVITWPSNPTAGHTSRGSSNLKRCVPPDAQSSTTHNSHDTGAAWTSTDRRVGELRRVHTTEHHSAIKKDQTVPPAATWMDGRASYRVKSDREKQVSYGITYMLEY